MLDITTDLHEQTIARIGATSSKGATVAVAKMETAAFTRGPRLMQLGINYRWSDVVVDHRRLSDGGVGKAEIIYNPYGEDDFTAGGPLQAGDRAPNAPGLHLLNDQATPANVPTTLFDLYSSTAHVALIFTPLPTAGPHAVLIDIVAALGAYKASLVNTYIVRPSQPEGPGTTTNNVPGTIGVLVDTVGHAASAYIIPRAEGDSQARMGASNAPVVIIRPDGVIGALVGDANGVKEYFSKIFL